MKRLLIIDDSAVVRKVAERILQAPELEIAHAENGLSGIAMCREIQPDIILLDSTLPDQSAVEVLTALRERYRDSMPTTLLMVNEVDIVPIMKAKRAGASGYLLKPFNRAQLTAAFAPYLTEEAARSGTSNAA